MRQIDKLRDALERIADPMNTHFAGDAQVVAREALAAALAAPSAEPVALVEVRKQFERISDDEAAPDQDGRIAQSQAAAGEMPPLPEPLTYIAQFHGEWRETVSVGDPVFTAAQVRDYARSCMATTPAAQPMALTFDAFRAANRMRSLKWHPGGIESWSASDWVTAIAGELGELASLIKMRNRERDGLPGNKFSPSQKQIADEAADVLTYLDLFCEMHGIDLGLAAVSKFNEVSERVGFPDRITLAQPPAAPLSEDLQQIIYAIERSARTLERQADELHEQRDYSAGLPAADAESLRKAVALLKGCRFGAEG